MAHAPDEEQQMQMAAKNDIGAIIEQSARECGVDPNDPVFRAKLTKQLIAAGYFSRPA